MKGLLLLLMAGLFVCSCDEETSVVEVEEKEPYGLQVVKSINMVFKQFQADCVCNYEIPPPDNMSDDTGFGGGGDTTDEAIDQAIADCGRKFLAQYKPAPSAEDCQLFEKTSKQEIRSLCKCKNGKFVNGSGNTVDEAITKALKKAKTNPHCSEITKSHCTLERSIFYKAIKK